jgi:hypothetical protein
MPAPPKAEFDYWYQFYFATERGRLGYEKYLREFCKLIWKTSTCCVAVARRQNFRRRPPGMVKLPPMPRQYSRFRW